MIDDINEEIKRIQECWNDDKCNGVGYNVTSVDKLPDKKVSLSWFIPDHESDELVMPYEELIHIIKKWGELREQNSPYIIIEFKDDKWIIYGSDSMPKEI